MSRIAALLLALVLPLAQAGAVTLHVPGDYLRIQSAIDAAAAGDTVRVAEGIFSGPGNRGLDLRGKSLVLIGAGPGATLIDCEGRNRGFRLVGGEGRDTLIRGFTVLNGSAPGGDLPGKGGGIYCSGSSPRIECCHFRGGIADYGGGLAVEWEADPAISHCVFVGNRARIEGNDLWVW